MNKKRENGPLEKVSFKLVLEILHSQMTALLLVGCSMTLAWRLQTHDHQSWSWNARNQEIDIYQEIVMCCRAESRTSSVFSV